MNGRRVRVLAWASGDVVEGHDVGTVLQYGGTEAQPMVEVEIDLGDGMSLVHWATRWEDA